MDCYRRHQFDVLMGTAVDRFADRLGRRYANPLTGIARLRSDQNGVGTELEEFVAELFSEHCLDDVAGATYVLQVLHKSMVTTQDTVSDVVGRLATDVFAELLKARVVENLARAGGKQSMKGTP